jgi:hypothetical protein
MICPTHWRTSACGSAVRSRRRPGAEGTSMRASGGIG